MGGYEVLTATDGFAALQVLRGGQPDLLVTELNLQRMSGFELLSVVRSRFPGIGVIAVSSEYTAVTVPDEAICDTFLTKGPNLDFELVAEAERLISESPVRGSRPKTTASAGLDTYVSLRLHHPDLPGMPALLFCSAAENNHWKGDLRFLFVGCSFPNEFCSSFARSPA